MGWRGSCAQSLPGVRVVAQELRGGQSHQDRVLPSLGVPEEGAQWERG